MNVILRSIRTQDSPIDHRGRIRPRLTFGPSVRARDEILNAQPTGKVLALGDVWNGIRRYADSNIATYTPIVSGLTGNNTLDPEAIGDVLDLGKHWTDSLRRKLLKANDAAEGGDGGVDVTEVLKAVEALHGALGTRDPVKIGDSLKRLKRARDSVESEVQQAIANKHPRMDSVEFGSETGEHDMVESDPLQRMSQDNAIQIRRMQAANTAFWNKRNRDTAPSDDPRPVPRATGDANTTEVRDALALVNRAPSNAGLNDLFKKFWAAR